MHSLLNRYLSRQKEPGIISLVVLRSHWTKLFHDLDLAEGRNSATGSRPKTQSFSSVILMVLPIKESLNFQRTFIHTFNIQGTEGAETPFLFAHRETRPTCLSESDGGQAAMSKK
jgi:hypothetical protein